MKKLGLMFFFFLIFLGCAWLGFQMANQTGAVLNKQSEVYQPPAPSQNEQQNLLLIMVDQLNIGRPRLVSIWFVSSFVMEGQPLTLTFAQVYPGKDESKAGSALEKSFSLDAQGNPAAPFWKAFQAYDLSVKDFVIVDAFGLNRILSWIADPNSDPMAGQVLDPTEMKQRFEQTCQNLDSLRGRTDPFPWSELVPQHFHSNLLLETILVSWEQMTDPDRLIQCEYFPSS